jgi:imidazolonepropionase-like amidohydrolase
MLSDDIDERRRPARPWLAKLFTYGGALLMVLAVLLLAIIAARLPTTTAPAMLSTTTATTAAATTTTTTTVPLTPAPTPQRRQHAICAPLRGGGTRSKEAHRPIVIRRATVLSGDRDGTVLQDRDVLLQDGVVRAVEAAGVLSVPADALVVDAAGRFVSPGLVDMHSHAGVYSYPSTFGTDDGNEMTNPITPMVRAIDAFNAHDPAIDDINRGGVTTIQSIPGSGNAMGGEGLVLKTWPRRTGRAVLHRMHVASDRVHLKMATGENPKRTYGRRSQMPMSRMGSAWVMRQRLEAAAKLRDQQDRWCAGADGSADVPPTDLSLQNLVRLLRGEAILNIHSYRTCDFEMLMMLSDEFGFKIDSVHHAHDAFQIADELARRNISAALFSDNYMYKVEASEGSIKAPAILDAAGVRVAFKSDHPVLDASYLMFEAQRGAHNGLAAARALAAVTSVPAAAIGMAGRVGCIAVGCDADVVVWDRHPLDVGARPDLVTIEGVVSFEQPVAEKLPNQPAPAARWNASLFDCAGAVAPGKALVLRGARLFLLADDRDNATRDGQTGTVVVGADGVLLCADFGANACAGSVAAGATVLDVPATFHITPGFVVADPSIRLGDEILASVESTGGDGVASGDFAARLNVTLAAGGVHGSTRLSRGVFADGILAFARSPETADVLGGVAALFRTGDGFYGNELLAEPAGAVLSDAAALHVQLGNGARSDGLSNSISGQVAAITKLLSTTLNGTLGASAATRGVVIRAHHADDILAALRLAKQFPALPWRLVGGGEAHLVAQQIAAAGLPLIVSPPRCRRDTLETMRCREDRVRTLIDAGVKLAISTSEADTLRGLRLDVGHEWARNRLSERAALRSIAQVPGALYGVSGDGVGSLVVGKPARLVLFSGHPLIANSVAALVVDAKRRRCGPQEAPFIGYEDYAGYR